MFIAYLNAHVLAGSANVAAAPTVNTSDASVPKKVV